MSDNDWAFERFMDGEMSVVMGEDEVGAPPHRDHSHERGIDAVEMYVEVLFGVRQGTIPD